MDDRTYATSSPGSLFFPSSGKERDPGDKVAIYDPLQVTVTLGQTTKNENSKPFSLRIVCETLPSSHFHE